MPLPLIDVALHGYRPGNTSDTPSGADYQIPALDLSVIDISERAGPLRDTAKLRFDNQGGKYTGVVDHGDRLRFVADTTGGSNDGYGVGGYGAEAYGSTLEHLWTGMVRNYTISGGGGDLFEFEVDGQDYVQAVLGMRRVYGSFEDELIVDSTNGILNRVLEDEAPEIDPSQLPDLADRTDIFVSGVKLMDFVGELADRAGVIVASDETALQFRDPESIQAKFDLQPSDHRVLELKSNDDNVVNSMRIDGGQDYDLGDAQTTQSSYTTVTDTSRVTRQLNHTKSEVDRIEIWTRTTGLEDDVIVRLQKDDGGAPIAPDSRKADLARKKLSHEFLADEGWTTFILPKHDIPGINPWVLVEAESSQGQDIGVDGSGNLTYKSYYPYPVNVSVPDSESQDAHGLREGRIKDDSITTFTAAEDLADTHLQKYSTPAETVSFRADSDRADRLPAGGVIQIEYPRIGASGMYVVTERQRTLTGARLVNDLSLRRLPDAMASSITPPA